MRDKSDTPPVRVSRFWGTRGVAYTHYVGMHADLKSATIEIWEHRELLEQLTRRDIKLRYKQAAMGFAWAVFMPCLIVCPA